MKSINLSFFILLLLTCILSACNQRKPVEVVTAAEEIKTSDESAVITRPDTSSLDAQTNETALQQDAPTSDNTKPVVTNKVCDPSFTLLGKPTKTQQVFYVSGFNPGEFKCWNLLEEHALKICGEQPCVISYLDSPDVKTTSTGPNYVSDQILMQHGIGRFEHNGKFWDIKGARVWKRQGKEYGYYNTNNSGGG